MTQLTEGFHYISVVAFRHRDSDESDLFAEWREAIYVDREPPAITVPNLDDITGFQHEVVVLAEDRTTNRVHVMWDLPDRVDPLDAADFTNQADQHDRLEYRWTVATGGHGFHRLTVVAFEETGNASVNDFEVFVDLCDADIIDDGDLDADDFFAYLDLFAAGC